MLFSRGMRDKISKYIDINSELCVKMHIDGPDIYDFCCFGLDKVGKLSDDRYMIFYNQTSSPYREINIISNGNSAEFHINLSKLPLEIEKLVFTVNIDGNGTMGTISKHCVFLSQDNQHAISMELSGLDFKAEKAIISIEIYRKNEWRIAAVANGFNGGLSALLKEFGGIEILSDSPATQNAPLQQINQVNSVVEQVSHESEEEKLEQVIMGKINLSKDKVTLKKHVVNLSKCVVDLSKKSGVNLPSIRAKVVVALDYSGSMYDLYYRGTVQHTLNRLVPLGLTFDDNGSIDIYLFQDTYTKLIDLNLSNYENYVTNVIQTSGYRMGGTQYAPVLQAIINDGNIKTNFFEFGKKTTIAEEDPIFILFITDGENFDKVQTDQIIRKSSTMNVFIQFIGIGNHNFKYLTKLDDMPGRKRDNTGFSKMQSLDNADDNELYTKVLEQFSAWLKGLQ